MSYFERNEIAKDVTFLSKLLITFFFYHIIIVVILMDIDFIISKLIDDTNYAKLLIKYENLTDIDK